MADSASFGPSLGLPDANVRATTVPILRTQSMRG